MKNPRAKTNDAKYKVMLEENSSLSLYVYIFPAYRELVERHSTNSTSNILVLDRDGVPKSGLSMSGCLLPTAIPTIF